MRPLPTDTATMLTELMVQYPARCRLSDETERDHERYAGKVDLLEELMVRLDRSPKTTY